MSQMQELEGIFKLFGNHPGIQEGLKGFMDMDTLCPYPKHCEYRNEDACLFKGRGKKLPYRQGAQSGGGD